MEKIRLGIFASGGGSTGEVIFDKAEVVLTNNPKAGVIVLARQYGVPCEVLPPRSEFRVVGTDGQADRELSREKYGKYIIGLLKKYNITHGSLNGFDTLIPANVVNKFKIVNSHPGPLDPNFPDFGGEGMHGLAVHQAVLEFARMVNRPFNSSVCLHKAAEEFDKGELYAYSEVDIFENDDAQSLQNRVKGAERAQNITFWDMVEKNDGKLIAIKRKSRVILPGEERFLEEAKKKAIELYPKG